MCTDIPTELLVERARTYVLSSRQCCPTRSSLCNVHEVSTPPVKHTSISTEESKWSLVFGQTGPCKQSRHRSDCSYLLHVTVKIDSLD